MADYKEVLYDRLFVKVPGTDRLRKRAAGRLKHLLASGWRETDRRVEPEYVVVRLERSGQKPTLTEIPKTPPPPPRAPRGRDGQRGGFRGRGGGGPRR